MNGYTMVFKFDSLTDWDTTKFSFFDDEVLWHNLIGGKCNMMKEGTGAN